MSNSTVVGDLRTLLLNENQAVQRINRLAYQIYEDNAIEKDIVLAGIMKNGFSLCEKIAVVLRAISPITVVTAEVHVNKHSQVNDEVVVSISKDKFENKVVILIDDVLNSGKTMLFALKPFLAVDVKKIRTVVLIDRNHKRFPVAADFAGLSLSTTLQEHVSVEFTATGICAWLS
jgi:pyrimidine operon attenuation protein/uracil phosphoribosyltransferase